MSTLAATGGSASNSDWSDFRRTAVRCGNLPAEMPERLRLQLDSAGVAFEVVEQVCWLMVEPMEPAPPPTATDPWPDPRPGVGSLRLWSAVDCAKNHQDFPQLLNNGLFCFGSGPTSDGFAVDLTQEIGVCGLLSHDSDAFAPDSADRSLRQDFHPTHESPVSLLIAAADGSLPLDVREARERPLLHGS